MDTGLDLNKVYKPSDNIVAREVQGEFIIIPITSGIGDLEDELFTLNETGKAIWDRLDGKKTLKDIITLLSSEFDGPGQQIEKDVLGLAKELLKRTILIEVGKN